MSEQTPIDYYEMFSSLIMRASALSKQRDELETEMAKLRQLIVATFPLIPEDKQKLFQTEVSAMDEENGLGLMEAIKLVFSIHKGESLTASKVRDYLEETGFDFRRYRTNPLASITTTLKRMVPSYLETSLPSLSEGAVTYKRRKTLGDRIAEGYGQTVPPPPGADDLPVSNPSHRIHHPPPIAKVEDLKPRYGPPDPLNQRGKK